MKTAKFHIIIPPQDIQDNPECLGRIAAGDSTAFGWLYKNYCRRLYDYLYLLTNDKQLSEDIVQDVFLKIWTGKEKLVEIKNFNGYVFLVAKNILLDKWRKQQIQKEVFTKIAAVQPRFEHNLFHQRNEEKAVSLAVKTLSPKQQLIYRMIREEGNTRDEVSNALDISPNTVKSTMQKALHRLKEELTETR